MEANTQWLKNKPRFQLSFNGFLKVDFQGSRVTSDGGLILIRELEAAGPQADPRNISAIHGKVRTRSSRSRSAAAVGLLSVGGLRGSQRRRSGIRRSDVSLDRLEEELGSRRGADVAPAKLRTGMLAGDENLIGLMAVNRELVAQAEGCGESERVVLDMDSTESPVHGQQEGSARHESVCYHSLLLFNHARRLPMPESKLRPRATNRSNSEDWNELLLPVSSPNRLQAQAVTIGPSAFVEPEISAYR